MNPQVAPKTRTPVKIILSFDIEEHHRIEAAQHLTLPPEWQSYYGRRMDYATRWILEMLAEKGIAATFFCLGDITRSNPGLIKAIHAAGHEVASHGWDHRRVHHFTRETFAEDVRQSKDALEQVAGAAVVGYRAPTFSITRETYWALEVLAEQGFQYDSSIFPVRHDRYGIPDAPRTPFWVIRENLRILEIPPLTWRVMGLNLPIAGGGYFRLFPRFLLRQAIQQAEAASETPVAMLYFHPWEFDKRQSRLALGSSSLWRTYVGQYRSRARMAGFIQQDGYCCGSECLALLANRENDIKEHLLLTSRL